MRKMIIKIMTVLLIVGVVIPCVYSNDIWGDSYLYVKNLRGGGIGDAGRMYEFTSQSGEPLPVLEYKDSVYVPLRSFCKYVKKGVNWAPGSIEIYDLPANEHEGKVFGERQNETKYPIVSMIELIANPEKYDGKNVSVKGIVNIGYESDAVFLTKEDLCYFNMENCIEFSPYSLEFPMEEGSVTEYYEAMGDITGTMVEMQGVFKAKEIDSDGFGARGYLQNITCIYCLETI